VAAAYVGVMTRPLAWLHPRLVAISPADRREALRHANREPFDPAELVGLAAALVLAGWLAVGGYRWLAAVAASSAAVAILFTRCRRGLNRMFDA